MLRGRDGVELGGKGFEVRVLGELALALQEVALGFGLEVDLRWAERVLFGDEVVLVYGFYVRKEVQYCRE